MIRPGTEEKILHSTLKIGETMLMLSDGHCDEESHAFHGFSLSLPVANEEEAKQYFTALSEGGEVRMPLGPTFFSPCFGMLADKFGIGWMIIIPQA